MSFFHGVRVKEGTPPPSPIQTPRSSVIGLAGTSATGDHGKLYVIRSIKEARDIFRYSFAGAAL